MQGRTDPTAVKQVASPVGAIQERHSADAFQKLTSVAKSQEQTPSNMKGAQQRPQVNEAGSHSGTKPSKSSGASLESQSPKESQKSSGGQLVRNRVDFNPLL